MGEVTGLARLTLVAMAVIGLRWITPADAPHALPAPTQCPKQRLCQTPPPVRPSCPKQRLCLSPPPAREATKSRFQPA